MELWIAFKNLIFDYWTQHTDKKLIVKNCCELLSKILSLTIEHNHLWGLPSWLLLWIAFKNLIFDYWTQLPPPFGAIIGGCELLSKILSLTIEHNKLKWIYTNKLVVNCFQKSYLWLLNTTTQDGRRRPLELWIAFKNLIFDYWTQLIV